MLFNFGDLLVSRPIKLIQKILSATFNMILPQRCVMCQAFTADSDANIRQPTICSTCWKSIGFIVAPFCEKCAAPMGVDGAYCTSCHSKTFAFDSARAALVYDDVTKKMIMRFKHHGLTHYARLFAPWLRVALTDLSSSTAYDGIVPVPLHPIRMFKRGFNQSTALAEALLTECEQRSSLPLPPIITDALMRTRNTPAQGHKSPDQRSANMDGAFQGNTAVCQGKRFLLIDDVMTTGASLHSCALALKAAGALRVDVLVVARAIKG